MGTYRIEALDDGSAVGIPAAKHYPEAATGVRRHRHAHGAFGRPKRGGGLGVVFAEAFEVEVQRVPARKGLKREMRNADETSELTSEPRKRERERDVFQEEQEVRGSRRRHQEEDGAQACVFGAHLASLREATSAR